jgi:hypothetical protein
MFYFLKIAVIDLLINTNPWIIFLVAVTLYYVLKKIGSFQQGTSGGTNESLSKMLIFALKLL